MGSKNFNAALAVSLAALSLPLACGVDDPPNAGGGSGSGPGGEATGGNGGNTTGGASGSAGNATGATGGSGGKATGGSGGKATGGSGGEAASGSGGEGGTSGGEGGTPGDGVGGEGGTGIDPWNARCERVCDKGAVSLAECPDKALCIQRFCVETNLLPYCFRYADAMLECLDTEGTADDFVCWLGLPSFGGGETSPCNDEVMAGVDVGCF
jgi:hypothetical protein